MGKFKQTTTKSHRILIGAVERGVANQVILGDLHMCLIQ